MQDFETTDSKVTDRDNQPITAAWKLRNADRTLRYFLTGFLLMLTVGYAIGLLFVDHTTAGTQQGLVEQYRGSSDSTATEMRFAKSPDEMYIFLHNHILSLSLVFFTVGAIFYTSSVTTKKVKEFLIVEPFVAIATTFGGIWLMRFVSEYFSWLVIVSGTFMVLCYLAMVALILFELWWKQS